MDQRGDSGSDADLPKRLAEFAQALEDQLGRVGNSNDDTGRQKEGQMLNEEGLPFIDVTEALSDDEASRGRGAVLPFVPEHKSPEEKKAWMDSIFAQLESEEGALRKTQIQDGGDRPVGFKTDSSSSSSSHKRVASSDRPAPPKSVLKPTSSITPPLQKFGSSGLRKGFLNMNPHSPGAEHSSDPIDDIKWAEDPMSGSTSSLGSVASQMSGMNNTGGRTSRSTEIVPARSKKKKKTVRIQSPEARERRRPSAAQQLAAPLRQASGHSMRDDADQGVEEEAKEIVKLLGIDAIKGHPQYESLKASAENEALQAEQAFALQTTPKASGSERPAIRRDVIERSPAQSTSNGSNPSVHKSSSIAQDSSSTALKGGLPTTPQISQGITALERATNADEPISDARVAQGLPPAVPHARPSKAYAEKLEARKRGEQSGADKSEQDGDELPAKMSKVRFGEDRQGNVDVRIGEAATQATYPIPNGTTEGEHTSQDHAHESDSDAEEEFAAMGLSVHEEELDDDHVEALGYFSNEEEDPDLGFDSDDLDDLAPSFTSDAADIDNEELRREYERIKASLNRTNSFQPPREANQLVESAPTDGEDIIMADGADNPDSNSSRFRRERLHRALLGHSAVSKELGGTEAGNRTNPSMLIPSLANVRYPTAKPDHPSLASADDVQLDGESDEEDHRLESVMRARLADRDRAKMAGPHDNFPQNLATDVRRVTDAPPEVTRAADSGEKSSGRDAAGGKTKKASLFKARMRGADTD